MANRNFPSNKLYNGHVMVVQLDASVAIGASGAPTLSASASPLIKAISRLAAGIYQVQLQDNYNSLIMLDASMRAPAPGANVASGSLVTGTAYSISVVGTTNWQSVGLPSGVTAAVGSVFVATGTAAGTGMAKAVTSSAIGSIERIGSLQAHQPASAQQGGFIMLQCLDVAGALADPANGSVLNLRLLLSNSSVQ